MREFAGQERGLDGHPVIETALAELYRETGTAAYLELARQFVDQRGRGLAGNSGMGRRYLQDHLPVRATDTEVGHVVRALYLEAGVTDVAAETGDRELLESSLRRWDDMVAAKTYLTGGNGSRHADEGFGDRFELPPDRAYNETCAAIASFQWCWRLLLATGDAKYADHMERVLYNGFGAAIATEGQRFFYVNPLQRREDHFEKDDPAGAACGSTAPAARRTSCASSPRWSTTSPPSPATRCTSTSTPGPGCPGRAWTWRSPPTTRGPAPSTCGCSPRRRTRAGWRCGCRPGAPVPVSRSAMIPNGPRFHPVTTCFIAPGTRAT